jgi:hypothetical protein
MKICFSCIITIAVLTIAGNLTPAGARTPDCAVRALNTLRESVPEEFAIYEALADKTQFKVWLKCQDLQLDLSTAVHESVHTLTETEDAFPLIGGQRLRRPQNEPSHLPPPAVLHQKLAADLGPDDIFLATYIERGSASSAEDFVVLLDELNAFAHDLNTATRLYPLHPVSALRVDHRDGLAAIMVFTQRYLDHLEEKDSRAWAIVRTPQFSEAISHIWQQAERVLSASCPIPDFGTDDQRYIELLCRKKNGRALHAFLKTPAQCPARCLDAPR